jgi:hypothetical protein
MKTTGVLPDALAASISLSSRSEIEAVDTGDVVLIDPPQASSIFLPRRRDV